MRTELDWHNIEMTAEERGVLKGLEKGREEGLKEGIEQGREDGLKEGIEQGQKKIIQNMLAKGFSPEQISEMTGIAIDDIKS